MHEDGISRNDRHDAIHIFHMADVETLISTCLTAWLTWRLRPQPTWKN